MAGFEQQRLIRRKKLLAFQWKQTVGKQIRKKTRECGNQRRTCLWKLNPVVCFAWLLFVALNVVFILNKVIIIFVVFIIVITSIVLVVVIIFITTNYLWIFVLFITIAEVVVVIGRLLLLLSVAVPVSVAELRSFTRSSWHKPVWLTGR